MRMLLGWAAVLAVASSPAVANEPLQPPGTLPAIFSTEAGASVGVMGLGFAIQDGRWGDLFVTPSLDGRWRWGALGVDGGLLFTLPTMANGAGWGGRITARLGFVGERFTIVAGPVIEYGAAADPALQILPSLRAQASFGSWGLSAGLLDHHGLALAHLTAEVGDYGVGYVAPLGATAHARFWLTPRVALRVQALASAIGTTQQALFTAGLVFRPGTP